VCRDERNQWIDKGGHEIPVMIQRPLDQGPIIK
jgi:hypothetical protein